jgi:hypothetical protein
MFHPSVARSSMGIPPATIAVASTSAVTMSAAATETWRNAGAPRTPLAAPAPAPAAQMWSPRSAEPDVASARFAPFALFALFAPPSG